MTDTTIKTQAAIFAALSGNVGATVYDHVPDNTRPPVVVIDQILTDNEPSKDGAEQNHTVEIVTITQAHSRQPLWTIMAAIYAALHDQEISADGVSFTRPQFVSKSEENVPDAASGPVYIGRQTFQVYAY